MTVLLALERGAGAMTLTQIAPGAGMAPSKAHRNLASLCRVGLLSQAPTSGLYDLGPAIRRLGAEALRRTDGVAIATEHVQRLRDRTGHSVALPVWGENGPVLVRPAPVFSATSLPLVVGTGLPNGLATPGGIRWLSAELLRRTAAVFAELRVPAGTAGRRGDG